MNKKEPDEKEIVIRIPKVLEDEPLPAGYFDPPDPYVSPAKSHYNFRDMVNYAAAHGKMITDLTKEEAKMFLIDRDGTCEKSDNDGGA